MKLYTLTWLVEVIAGVALLGAAVWVWVQL